MKTKEIQNKKNSPFALWVFIGIMLFIFWFLAGLLYTSFGNYLVLSDNFTASVYQNSPENQLLKGQKLFGQFTATENNLGIVSFRLIPGNNGHSEQDDFLLFKIKEKNAKNWYYTKTYESGALRGFTFFPIGFPLIPNSKGKTYQFEIKSLKGNDLNAVTVVRAKPVMIAKYQFTKSDLFHGGVNPVHFIFKKAFYFLTDPDDLANSSIFFVPFILYIVWLLSIRYHILRERALLLITLFIIFFQLIFYSSVIYGIILALVMLWIVVLYKDRLNSDYTFLLSVCIFFIGEVGIFYQIKTVEMESSILVYLLLFIGAIQLVREIKYNPKNLFQIEQIREIFTAKKNKE